MSACKLTTALAMSRLLAFLLVLILLHSSSCEVEGFEEGAQYPFPYHKMSVRERMVVEYIMRDDHYRPSGANNDHDPHTPHPP